MHEKAVIPRKKIRKASVPNLLGPLSAENAQWHREQVEVEREGRRQQDLRKYENDDHDRAYGAVALLDL